MGYVNPSLWAPALAQRGDLRLGNPIVIPCSLCVANFLRHYPICLSPDVSSDQSTLTFRSAHETYVGHYKPGNRKCRQMANSGLGQQCRLCPSHIPGFVTRSEVGMCCRKSRLHGKRNSLQDGHANAGLLSIPAVYIIHKQEPSPWVSLFYPVSVICTETTL